MEVLESARKHGIDDQDIRHATTTGLLRTIEQAYDDEVRILAIGADRAGRLLEIVVVDDEDGQRIIHADHLRAKFYDYL